MTRRKPHPDRVTLDRLDGDPRAHLWLDLALSGVSYREEDEGGATADRSEQPTSRPPALPARPPGKRGRSAA